jgi:hypothetical protein
VEFNIYCCADGALLLVPTCCQPSLAAEQLFGPLRWVGNVDLDDGSLGRNALDGIDHDTFARLDDASSIRDLLAIPSFHYLSDHWKSSRQSARI